MRLVKFPKPEVVDLERPPLAEYRHIADWYKMKAQAHIEVALCEQSSDRRAELIAEANGYMQLYMEHIAEAKGLVVQALQAQKRRVEELQAGRRGYVSK